MLQPSPNITLGRYRERAEVLSDINHHEPQPRYEQELAEAGRKGIKGVMHGFLD
jgi:hypothetical protein